MSKANKKATKTMTKTEAVANAHALVEEATSKGFYEYEFAKPTEVNGTKVTKIKIRAPKAGELRGLSLLSVSQVDLDTVLVLAPRISDLTRSDMENLPAGDLMQIGFIILAFLN